MRGLSITFDAASAALIVGYLLSWFSEPWLLIAGGVCLLISCLLWTYANQQEMVDTHLPGDEEDGPND